MSREPQTIRTGHADRAELARHVVRQRLEGRLPARARPRKRRTYRPRPPDSRRHGRLIDAAEQERPAEPFGDLVRVGRDPRRGRVLEAERRSASRRAPSRSTSPRRDRDDARGAAAPRRLEREPSRPSSCRRCAAVPSRRRRARARARRPSPRSLACVPAAAAPSARSRARPRQAPRASPRAGRGSASRCATSSRCRG